MATTPETSPAPDASRRSGRAPVPAFAPTATGDDLCAARRFVECAVDGLPGLNTHDREGVEAWLEMVEAHARPLQARAVLRAVSLARMGLDGDDLGARLSAIAALIAQYEGGLVDVESQIEAGVDIVLDPVDYGANRARPATASVEPAPGVEPAREALEDRFEAARAGLAELLPRVDTHGHIDALERLVSLTPEDFGTDVMVAPEAQVDNQAEESQTPVPQPPVRGLVDIDVLLPGLADHAARMARLHGKSATVSFGAVEARLPAHMAQEWRDAVATALVGLCETTLERPRDRRARGLSGTSHIELSARGVSTPAGGQGVELRIACPGASRPTFEVDAPHTVSTHSEAGRVVLVFTAYAEAEGRARAGDTAA